MWAYRSRAAGGAGFEDVPEPSAGPGEVRVRVGAVGLCGTDLRLIEANPFGVAYTLGHEVAGWVDGVGDGVAGLQPGDAVALVAGHPCGTCRWCFGGRHNLCPGARRGRGYGLDGGLAPLVVAPAHHVLPIGDLDPEVAAPLTDAAATAHHAVNLVRADLALGATAVVIGVGGLGGYGIQLLKMHTAVVVVAVEAADVRREVARALGADVVLAPDGAADRVRALTGGHGADVVLDFVGVQDAVDIAFASIAPGGRIVLVGGGGGTTVLGHATLPRDVSVVSPVGSTVAELVDLLRLAAAGRLTVEAEPFALDRVEEAYQRLRSGSLRGRAVVVPPPP